jgi:hypothetical protein
MLVESTAKPIERSCAEASVTTQRPFVTSQLPAHALHAMPSAPHALTD